MGKLQILRFVLWAALLAVLYRAGDGFFQTYVLPPPIYPNVPDRIGMRPGYDKGDRLWARRLADCRQLRPGDLVVFRHPDSAAPTGVDLARVVARPGKRIQINEQGQVLVNGRLLPEPYRQGVRQEAMPELRVPRGHLFLLVDDRYPVECWDSRRLGPVPFHAVIGYLPWRQGRAAEKS